MIDGKSLQEEKGYVYLASSSAQSGHDSWLIEFGASYQMISCKEWFCEYENIYGDDVFLGDDSLTRIVGHEKFN